MSYISLSDIAIPDVWIPAFPATARQLLLRCPTTYIHIGVLRCPTFRHPWRSPALATHRDVQVSRDDCMDAGGRATPGAVAEAGCRERPALTPPYAAYVRRYFL